MPASAPLDSAVSLIARRGSRSWKVTRGDHGFGRQRVRPRRELDQRPPEDHQESKHDRSDCGRARPGRRQAVPVGSVQRIIRDMAGGVASHRFVGRSAELDRLEAAFAQARSGAPVTVCVGGEAGVGKTRLVSEFAARVRQSGGRCCSVADRARRGRTAVCASRRGVARSRPGAGARWPRRAGRTRTADAGPPAA